MATDSAPSRNLWQLPIFLLGIGALAAVWYGRPYWQLTPAQRFERDLAALKQLLDKSPVDVGQVQAQLKKVQGVDPPPHLAAQTTYAVGSSLAIIAEATASREEADQLWQSARQMLEEVESNIPQGDRQRHRFRLARAWARTGEPAPKVIEALTATIDCGDDPSEGNRLLAELYLKLDPPDLKRARDACREYLARVLPGRTEQQQRVLNEARLLLGELHTRLGEAEDARKALERIGPDAPPEVLAAARIQLAKSYLAEEDWTAAIRCFEQARDVRGIRRRINGPRRRRFSTNSARAPASNRRRPGSVTRPSS